MTPYLRSQRVPFKFEGPEAEKFLKDVLTGPVRCGQETASWWALLTPQGKIIAEGLLGWHQNAFWLDVDSLVAPAFFKRMRMYKLRADVQITNLEATHCVGWGVEAPDNLALIADEDKRAGGIGFRIIGEKEKSQDWAHEELQFLATRIDAGIAELGSDFETETLFPHDIAMDLLGGIDFKKGCYVGQEVVSRMRHRGSARRRPVIVSGIQSKTDKEIVAEGRVIGKIGAVEKGRAVGILRLDRIPKDGQAVLGSDRVHLAVPSWASYPFGDSDQA